MGLYNDILQTDKERDYDRFYYWHFNDDNQPSGEEKLIRKILGFARGVSLSADGLLTIICSLFNNVLAARKERTSLDLTYRTIYGICSLVSLRNAMEILERVHHELKQQTILFVPVGYLVSLRNAMEILERVHHELKQQTIYYNLINNLEPEKKEELLTKEDVTIS